ncbi:MAG TPA: hypothetical protein H9898_04525 [Candidatus Anaerobiospirillum stercoravium]|nr:hypothetical protein [Candidatus Anaerobiospirillum stercoravium]
MNPNAQIKPQDNAHQPEQEPKGASLSLTQAKQAEQSEPAKPSAEAARAAQELSAPEVIADNSNSAKLDEHDYYNDDAADDVDDDDSDLIAIVRYRLEHPAPTIRVTLDELLTL